MQDPDGDTLVNKNKDGIEQKSSPVNQAIAVQFKDPG